MKIYYLSSVAVFTIWAIVSAVISESNVIDNNNPPAAFFIISGTVIFNLLIALVLALLGIGFREKINKTNPHDYDEL